MHATTYYFYAAEAFHIYQKIPIIETGNLGLKITTLGFTELEMAWIVIRRPVAVYLSQLVQFYDKVKS